MLKEYRRWMLGVGLIVIVGSSFCQNRGNTIILDHRKYHYSDTGGITNSYIKYFGDSLNDLELKGLDGEGINTKGKTVVYNFWFTTCKPCVAEMPVLNKLASTYQSDSTLFVGITFNVEKDIRAFLKMHEFLFKPISLSQAKITTIKKVGFYPLTMIVNKNGKIVFVMLSGEAGSKGAEKMYSILERQIKKCLKN